MSVSRKRMLTVIGARPQFVKAAVVSRYLSSLGEDAPLEEVLIHTGQHYDTNMSEVFFEDLRMPAPKVNLNVGSGNPWTQTARMIEGLGGAVAEEAPDVVVAYGDTNSTLAAAIVATQQGLPFVHIEAGERIYRRNDVPEESNRVVADHLAPLCLTSTRRAETYLMREGMNRDRVRFVGDTMYDLFLTSVPRLEERAQVSPESLELKAGEYHLATIHRAENTASIGRLLEILQTLDQSELPVLLPVHPRVRRMLEQSDWRPSGNLRLTEPLGYFDFLNMLVSCSRCVTDSGGVTREAFFAKKPCIIPMPNSWWTEVVEAGWAMATADNSELLGNALSRFTPQNEIPTGLFGDGNAAARTVEEIAAFAEKGRVEGAWHRHGTIHDLPAATPSELTYANFTRLVGALQEKDYQFAAFPEAAELLASGKKFVLMRHDIDFDLEKAARMAELEADLGVRATYFLMVRTDHYSLFSQAGTELATRILERGHHLGLHFDCASYPSELSTAELAAACRRESEMLENWLGKPVHVVSYHRPGALVLAGDPAISAPYPHTYLPEFTKEIHYLSDSNGRWQYGHPTESVAFAEGQPLHLLIHPFWWRDQPASPYETLLQHLDRSTERLERSMARNCKSYQVGWLAKEGKA